MNNIEDNGILYHKNDDYVGADLAFCIFLWCRDDNYGVVSYWSKGCKGRCYDVVLLESTLELLGEIGASTKGMKNLRRFSYISNILTL